MRVIRLVRWACIAVVGAALLVPATADAAKSVVVKTPQGAVRGIRAAGADRFLGLPYASRR